MSNEIVRYNNGALPSVFQGTARAIAKQHRQGLAHIDRQVELFEEAITGVHHANRTNIEELSMTAMVRDAAMQRDPAGAQVYARCWIEAAEAGNSLVIGLAQHLGRQLR